MLNKNSLIKVTNRADSVVGYTIPDLNLYRKFQPNETKEIKMDELVKLSYVPGGQYIIDNCLLISNQEAIKELMNGEVQPEYYYTEEDVRKILLEGTLDEFLDCLDFAPDGVIDIIKKLAVQLEINDIKKRDAILKKTGFNVTNAININKESASSEKTEEIQGGTGRRAAAPKYKVVG